MDKPAVAALPTKFGDFKVMVWPGEKGQESVAITTSTLDTTKPVLVRVHSECLTGDALGSLRCDCCDQKETALKLIAKSGNGIFIYLRQEGRGMGLFDKIRSYKLQEEGIDTHQASIMLGHEPDGREYSWAKKILEELGVKKIKLLTNNPAKVSEIFDSGFEVEKTPLVMKPNKHNAWYFEIKKKKFKHVFGRSGEMYHFFGITFTDLDTDIEPILVQLNNARTHPLLKFHIGFYADHATFSDARAVRKANDLIERIRNNLNTIPVLHYSSRRSPDVLRDAQQMKALFPKVKHVQINDVTDEYLAVLERIAKHFTFIAPLSDENIELIEDTRFRKLMLKHPSFVLLDNSKGTGKTEGYEAYQEKINRCLNYGLNNIALAGGFGPDSLDVYFKLKSYFKLDFSIDAESRLQSEGVLDSEKTRKYFDQLLHGNQA
jgi:GTP cyclohydrolase II